MVSDCLACVFVACRRACIVARGCHNGLVVDLFGTNMWLTEHKVQATQGTDCVLSSCRRHRLLLLCPMLAGSDLSKIFLDLHLQPPSSFKRFLVTFATMEIGSQRRGVPVIQSRLLLHLEHDD